MESEFPRRLRKTRDRRKMTRGALSEMCGLSKAMIGRYEAGKATPTIETLVQLADIFDTSTDYLLGLTDYPGKIL